jgi:hypothetical protein
MSLRWNPIYKRILSEIEQEVQIHPHYADLQNQFGLLLMVGEGGEPFFRGPPPEPEVSRGHS